MYGLLNKLLPAKPKTVGLSQALLENEEFIKLLKRVEKLERWSTITLP